MGVQVQVHLHPFTVLLGLVTGLIVPMLSNIYPIKQALGTSLRDALDRFRQGVDEMEVNFLRMENAGTNLTQVGVSCAILSCSILTLYFLPRAVLDMAIKDAFFHLNLLLVGCVVGIVFVTQIFALPLCKLFVDFILMFSREDRKLAALVYKNLESHSLKNLKANLLYSVTICFLIFQATNFLAIQRYISQMADSIFGSDINLLSMEPRSVPMMNELKIAEVLELNSV